MSEIRVALREVEVEDLRETIKLLMARRQHAANQMAELLEYLLEEGEAEARVALIRENYQRGRENDPDSERWTEEFEADEVAIFSANVGEAWAAMREVGEIHQRLREARQELEKAEKKARESAKMV